VPVFQTGEVGALPAYDTRLHTAINNTVNVIPKGGSLITGLRIIELWWREVPQNSVRF
jgi:hypothetical protein